MTGTKSPRRPGPAWLVILEDIRSQNRATMEALDTFRTSIEERFDRLERETVARFEVLELAVQNISRRVGAVERAVEALGVRLEGVERVAAGIGTRLTAVGRTLQEVQHTVLEMDTRLRSVERAVHEMGGEIGELTTRVDRLVPLESRITALENRVS